MKTRAWYGDRMALVSMMVAIAMSSVSHYADGAACEAKKSSRVGAMMIQTLKDTGNAGSRQSTQTSLLEVRSSSSSKSRSGSLLRRLSDMEEEITSLSQRVLTLEHTVSLPDAEAQQTGRGDAAETVREDADTREPVSSTSADSQDEELPAVSSAGPSGDELDTILTRAEASQANANDAKEDVVEEDEPVIDEMDSSDSDVGQEGNLAQGRNGLSLLSVDSSTTSLSNRVTAVENNAETLNSRIEGLEHQSRAAGVGADPRLYQTRYAGGNLRDRVMALEDKIDEMAARVSWLEK